jgi:hypothetical protein
VLGDGLNVNRFQAIKDKNSHFLQLMKIKETAAFEMEHISALLTRFTKQPHSYLQSTFGLSSLKCSIFLFDCLKSSGRRLHPDSTKIESGTKSEEPRYFVDAFHELFLFSVFFNRQVVAVSPKPIPASGTQWPIISGLNAIDL